MWKSKTVWRPLPLNIQFCSTFFPSAPAPNRGRKFEGLLLGGVRVVRNDAGGGSIRYFCKSTSWRLASSPWSVILHTVHNRHFSPRARMTFADKIRLTVLLVRKATTTVPMAAVYAQAVSTCRFFRPSFTVAPVVLTKIVAWCRTAFFGINSCSDA